MTSILVDVDQSIGAPTPLNYSALAPDVAEDMRNRADRIQNIQRASVLELGRELIAAKDLVDHGFFRKWVETACQMHIRAAERVMQAALFVEKATSLSYLPPDGLLTLASRSAPQAVVNEIIEEISAGQRPSAARIKRRISQAKQTEKRSRESPREGERREGPGCEHNQVEAATNELIAMLVAWDRFGDFTALLKKADLFSVAQALTDHHHGLAAASVIEGEPVVAEPEQTPLAPSETSGETAKDARGGEAIKPTSLTLLGAVADIPTDHCIEAAAEAASLVPSVAEDEIPIGDCAKAAVEVALPESHQASGDIPTDDCIVTTPESEPLLLSGVADQSPMGDCVKAAAEVAPLASPQYAGEISTDDCIETAPEAEPLLLSEAADEIPIGDCVEASTGTALEAVALEPLADVTAEKLMAMWAPLKRITRRHGRESVADGCPMASRPDEHPQITKRLVPFRAAASKASPAELQRFLEISTSQATNTKTLNG